LNQKVSDIRYPQIVWLGVYSVRENISPLKHYCPTFLGACHLSDERLVTSPLFQYYIKSGIADQILEA